MEIYTKSQKRAVRAGVLFQFFHLFRKIEPLTCVLVRMLWHIDNQ